MHSGHAHHRRRRPSSSTRTPKRTTYVDGATAVPRRPLAGRLCWRRYKPLRVVLGTLPVEQREKLEAVGGQRPVRPPRAHWPVHLVQGGADTGAQHPHGLALVASRPPTTPRAHRPRGRCQRTEALGPRARSTASACACCTGTVRVCVRSSARLMYNRKRVCESTLACSADQDKDQCYFRLPGLTAWVGSVVVWHKSCGCRSRSLGSFLLEAATKCWRLDGRPLLTTATTAATTLRPRPPPQARGCNRMCRCTPDADLVD